MPSLSGDGPVSARDGLSARRRVRLTPPFGPPDGVLPPLGSIFLGWLLAVGETVLGGVGKMAQVTMLDFFLFPSNLLHLDTLMVFPTPVL